jgi:nucleotide-binding universal stress UspA family protein/mono/diheme cytochrome c family protein
MTLDAARNAMVRNILCPVDFSDCSRRALQVALAVGRWAGAHVTVLNAGPAVLLYPALVARVTPAVVPTPTRAERAARVARFLEPFVDLHRPLDVILEEGDPAASIAAAMERLSIDLIVIGTHGRGGIGQWAFGSTTRQVVHAARCPVLVVPPGPQPLPFFHGFNRILCSDRAGDPSVRLLCASDRAQITPLPAGESCADILKAASDERADLIVWNREDAAIDALIRKAAVPVLSTGASSAPPIWRTGRAGCATGTTRSSMLSLIAVAVLLAAGGCARARSDASADDYTSGAYLFRTFCASCHGVSGRGDGPIAGALRVPTPDLTVLAARSGDVFPRREVFESIDGRRAVGIHGPSGMPIWGDALRQTQGQDEAIIRRRIDALVLHIESLQVKRQP